MAIINLGEFKGFTLIPEGWHDFKIVKVDYDEKFGKMEIQLVTKSGQKHTERYMLLDNSGEINQGGVNAFSFFARVAMNDFQIDSIDHEDLVGKFIRGKIEHTKSKKPSPRTGKYNTFANITEKEPSLGFADATGDDVDLSELDEL
jgi:hypothetical protein